MGLSSPVRFVLASEERVKLKLDMVCNYHELIWNDFRAFPDPKNDLSSAFLIP